MHKTYTLKQIKLAFWEVFHQSGEIWFGMKEYPNDADDICCSYYEDFVQALTGLEWDEVRKLIGDRNVEKM